MSESFLDQDTMRSDMNVLQAMAELLRDSESFEQALTSWRDAAIFMKGGMGARRVDHLADASPIQCLTARQWHVVGDVDQ